MKAKLMLMCLVILSGCYSTTTGGYYSEAKIPNQEKDSFVDKENISKSASIKAPPPTAEQISAMKDALGSLPDDYQKKVEDFIGESLVDPYSAVYKFYEAEGGYLELGDEEHRNFFPGYLVKVSVNAKNRMGGYAGPEVHFILIKNEYIQIVSPHQLSSWVYFSGKRFPALELLNYL